MIQYVVSIADLAFEIVLYFWKQFEELNFGAKPQAKLLFEVELWFKWFRGSLRLDILHAGS